MEETAPNCMMENQADVVPYFACYERRKLSRNWTALHLVRIPFGIRVEVSAAATDSGVRRSGRMTAAPAYLTDVHQQSGSIHGHRVHLNLLLLISVSAVSAGRRE